MESLLNDDSIPIGLGMALAQNLDALAAFSALSGEQKQRLIERTHGVHSKQEMQALVEVLANGNGMMG